MQIFESKHYIFHYNTGTYAERDIQKIALGQEECFLYICEVLKTAPSFKIQYYLCDSPEEVGRVYGDDEPCNGFASLPDKIYAVYNEQVQCVGFHEDVHVISDLINHPDSPAVREGLAMFFDRVWWGIHNLEWTRFYLKTGKYVPVDELLGRDRFFSVDCTISYPIMGAFTEWLITSYGIDAYIQFYKQPDPAKAARLCFHRSARELAQRFADYIRLFNTDREIENRMAGLLAVRNVDDTGQ